jgi:hypothetical protein
MQETRSRKPCSEGGVDRSALQANLVSLAVKPSLQQLSFAVG